MKILLSNEGIDEIASLIEKNLQELKIDKRQIVEFRLSAEEALLTWKEKLGEGAECNVKSGKRLGQPYLILSVRGECVNPFEKADEDAIGDSEVTRMLLANLGLAPSYNYRKGTNRITLTPKKKKMNVMLKMLVAIVAAGVVGSLMKWLLAPEIITVVNDDVLSPMFNTFMGVLLALAGPLMFFSVLWGIYCIGDITNLGRIGGKFLKRILISTFVITVISTLVGLLLYPISKDQGGFNGDIFKQTYEMLLGIIPANVVQPFSDGNTLQIMCEAIVIGLAVLVLGDKVEVFTTFVSQLKSIVQLITEAITELVPLFVFISILQMILTDVIDKAMGAGKLLLMCVVCMGIQLVGYFLILCIKDKVKPKKLVRKLMPTFLIALTTASSSAALGTNMSTCENRLGIDGKLCSFAIPLGTVMYMPGFAITYISVAMYMADSYGIEMNLTWMVSAVIMSAMLSIAAAPIPGSSLTCYALLFSQLGIPESALGFAIALNVVLDFIGTATNVSSLQMELTWTATKLNMINKKLLKL